MASDPSSGIPLRFRPATATDQAQLIALINAAFSIETFLEGTRTDEARLAPMMEKGTILVAEDRDGQLLACIYVEARGKLGYLGQLAVDPAHQGAGLARKMMAVAEERLRQAGCQAVEIIVLSLRPDLPPIYRRFGYREVRREAFSPTRKLKAGAECHGIVMSKAL